MDFVDRLAEQIFERMLAEPVRLDELRLEADADEMPPRLGRLVGLGCARGVRAAGAAWSDAAAAAQRSGTSPRRFVSASFQG